MTLLTNKMKTGQSKIQGVFDKFDSMVSDLQDGITALGQHKQKNVDIIDEKKVENIAIDVDVERANTLVTSLQTLVNG